MIIIDKDMQDILNHYGSRVEVIEDIEVFLDKINAKFAWSGSKIDKSKTSYHISSNIIKNENWGIEVKKFIFNNNLENRINSFNSRFFYINDSAIDYGLCLDKCLSIIFDLVDTLPQHHYFFDEDVNWCLVVSSEGYIDFYEPL